ncbi:MAG TPA: tetratricopeptide repeat protein [Candidatus Saccharibacteria bacterium]|jgi:tetratricopeptide (TPR) repeat protein|nr:tetratricopeptide repeat protein [Candidatus Saccharibacteria bacterium]HMR38717.1 tetratricopeptide repeat protein [Candidatus Saccharibacteria bacterium]
MLGILLLALLAGWIIWREFSPEQETVDIPERLSDKLDKLWNIAQESLRDRKYLRAEKALLTILRVDERNATAYNRLGILYAKQKAFRDAIECFEIAQSLESNASSLHNVGLIYFETGQYDKAALAFEQALEIDGEHASRHIAYAKVQEKLGSTKKTIASLEEAVRLEPSIQSYNILADAYERAGRHEEAIAIKTKLERVIAKQNTTPKRMVQKRKVIM